MKHIGYRIPVPDKMMVAVQRNSPTNDFPKA